MHNFRKMLIWKDAIDFTREVYGLCKYFPEAEKYGLTPQLQRAAVSIAANIAEGSGKGDVEFKKFLRIAISSAFEVETLLIIANEIGYLSIELLGTFIEKIQSIQKGIYKFTLQLA